MQNIWKLNAPYVNPTAVIDDGEEMPDMVQGLVPMQSVTWLYGPSMSFKSFAAMSIAAAVADGIDWMGLRTAESAVIYIGAEGGPALHLRRAAAELHAGGTGYCFAVVQERPQLDTQEGADTLKGILHGLLGLYLGRENEDRVAEIRDRAGFAAGYDRYNMMRDTGRLLATHGGPVLVIVDTYSQTSSGDDKASVAAYMKTLRDVIDDADASQDALQIAFLVVDHTTKGGGSYLGSVSKLNDVESQLELIRDGESMRTTLHHHKSKDGQGRPPIHLELSPFVFEGKLDAYGDPKTTLVIGDGRHAAALAALASGNAGTLMGMLMDRGGSATDADLRKAFYALPDYVGAKPDTAMKAYKRAKEDLCRDGLAELSGDTVRTSVL